jgi:Ca2+-transporting ATPase
MLFALAGAIVSIGVVILYGLFRGGWLEALLAGIAIGMPMLPEEFPVVLTIFMAMGAWRISRARVLTRRASAVDPFGPMEKAFHAFRPSLPPEILDQVRAR